MTQIKLKKFAVRKAVIKVVRAGANFRSKKKREK